MSKNYFRLTELDSYMIHEAELEHGDLGNVNTLPEKRLLEVDGSIRVPTNMYSRVITTSKDVIHS